MISVSPNATFNFEDANIPNEFIVIVEATDGNVVYPKTSEPDATVTIKITNENDNAPIFAGTPITAKVCENVDIGESVLTVTATDADNDKLTFSIKTKLIPFKINSSTGLIETTGIIDRETSDRYELTVCVTDGKTIVSTTVIITVIDKNDNDPVIPNVEKTFPEDTQNGTILVMLGLIATDADIGSFGELSFAIDNGDTSLFEIPPVSFLFT